MNVLVCTLRNKNTVRTMLKSYAAFIVLLNTRPPRTSMDSTVSPDKEKTTTTTPQRTRKSRVIGAIVAILAMLGLGALAWHLTHQAPAGGAGAGAGGRGQGG